MTVAATQTTAFSVLEEAGLHAFKSSLTGPVVLPGDADYDEIRKVFNNYIDRRPAVIARPLNTNDVVESVRFARATGLQVAVRGGGHSVAGHSAIDGGLLIDLSLMKKIEVKLSERIGVAQPGVKLGEFLLETEKYHLVTPTGTASDTGLAGLALGGGYGWLAGKYGLTLDNLVGLEVVTAEGDVVRADADTNPDLFWALRGGSGNFGIVTSFELQLHFQDDILGGMILYPYEQAREVLRYYRTVAQRAPDELAIYAGLMTLPQGMKAVAIALAYSGPIQAGQHLIAPIRAFGTPIVDMVHQRTYSDMNTLFDEAMPVGINYYWKWNGIRELSDEAIDTIISFTDLFPTPQSAVLIDTLHGAAARVSPDATAFAHRNAPHGLIINAAWDESGDSEASIAWARDFATAMEPFSTGGVYVNGASDEPSSAAYGANYDRLAKIKKTYDPTNFFRHNKNIAPAS